MFSESYFSVGCHFVSCFETKGSHVSTVAERTTRQNASKLSQIDNICAVLMKCTATQKNRIHERAANTHNTWQKSAAHKETYRNLSRGHQCWTRLGHVCCYGLWLMKLWTVYLKFMFMHAARTHPTSITLWVIKPWQQHAYPSCVQHWCPLEPLPLSISVFAAHILNAVQMMRRCFLNLLACVLSSCGLCLSQPPYISDQTVHLDSADKIWIQIMLLRSICLSSDVFRNTF